MSALDPPCIDGKEVSLSKPRVRQNHDGTLDVEIDLDTNVTLLFSRNAGPLVFCGAFHREHREPYAHEVPADVLSVARDRAIDACAQHDVEPPTERKGAP
jgi:hypothetical protein